MSRKKKVKYNDITASSESGENFGTLFPSMLKSKNFQSLRAPAKEIYVACRVFSKTEEARNILYAHGSKEGIKYSEHDFVFSGQYYELYTGKKRNNISQYFRELIDKGFLEKLEANKFRKDVNVYSFSDGWKTSIVWKTWTPEQAKKKLP